MSLNQGCAECTPPLPRAGCRSWVRQPHSSLVLPGPDWLHIQTGPQKFSPVLQPISYKEVILREERGKGTKRSWKDQHQVHRYDFSG